MKPAKKKINKKISVTKQKRKTYALPVMVNLQRATKSKKPLPTLAKFKIWVATTLEYASYASAITIKCNDNKRYSRYDKLEITIRLIGAKESAALNARYRHKENPTNVLSFPAITFAEKCSKLMTKEFAELASNSAKYLGDLAICIPVVEQEARAQNKSFVAHIAHMVIHGTLHCLGYTHDKKTAARLMEKTEVEIMQQLGFTNPYKE